MSEVLSETKSLMLNSREIEIPVDWSVEKIGDVAEKTKGTKPGTLYEEPDSDRLPYLTISASKDEVSQWAQADDGKRVSEEEILMVWDGASSGTVFKPTDGIIGSTLASFNFDDGFNNDFAYYFLSYYEARISSLGEGTGISHVPRDFTEVFEILRPPLSEQRRIAEILSTVHKEIQQTEEIIERTEALVQDLIDDLVQTGIRQNTQLHEVQIGPKKIGIPQKWDVLRVDELVSDEDDAIRTGPFGSKLKKEYLVSDGIKVYEQRNVYNNDFDQGNRYVTQKRYKSELTSYDATHGDVLIALQGTIGDAAVLPNDAESGVINQKLMRVRVNPEICLPDYFAMFFGESFLADFQIEAVSHGAVVSGLNISTVSGIRVPLPPVKEQQKIVEVVNKSRGKLSQERESKKELQDLKRGLMQDLLTGKVRISNPT
jgi:type I restriction enzyme S subunit